MKKLLAAVMAAALVMVLAAEADARVTRKRSRRSAVHRVTSRPRGRAPVRHRRTPRKVRVARRAVPATTTTATTPPEPRSPASASEAGGRLVYLSGDALMSQWADGSHVSRAELPSGSYPAEPEVAPDGRTVAFSLSPGGVSASLNEIWLWPADESRPRPIASVPGLILGNPTWSGDGRRLAYTVGYPAGYFGIGYQQHVWVMNADGTNQRPVAAMPGAAETPTWSPTGDEVAFTVDGQEVGLGIAVVHVDAVPPTPVMITPTDMIGANKPTWSPRGDRLSFMTSSSLYTVRPDGSDIRRIASGNNYPWNGGAAWSPDGGSLAYCLSSSGYFFGGANGTGPWVVSATGGDERMLAPDACFFPAWAPDGTAVASVVSERNGGVLVVRPLDGGPSRRLGSAGGSLSWNR